MNINRNQQIWAIILIALGLLFLFDAFRLLWPLLLIAIGLWLIFGRNADVTRKHDRFVEPVGAAASARVNLHLSIGSDHVRALPDGSENLVDADLNYTGDIHFTAQGTTEKYVELRQSNDSAWVWINPSTWFTPDTYRDLKWEIGLSPNVLLDLDVYNGVGEAKLDLGDLTVTDLNVRGGLGNMELTLPARCEPYPVRLQGGLGNGVINVLADSAFDLKIKGGMGGFAINVADGAAVRLTVSGGMGSVDIARSKFVQVDAGRSGDFEMRKSGTWQTPDFERAARQVTIQFDGGMGNLSAR